MATVTVAISTLSALIGITMAAGNVIHFTKNFVNGSVVELNSRHSILLTDRANTIAEILKNVDTDILVSNFGRRMIQTLVDSIEWSFKYNRKSTFRKTIKASKYRHIFATYHKAITRDMADLNHTLYLGTHKSVNKTDTIMEPMHLPVNNMQVTYDPINRTVQQEIITMPSAAPLAMPLTVPID